MPYNSKIHHRHSIRLRGYDYSRANGYFVTICTHERAKYLGRVIDGRMYLNDLGDIVDAAWKALPARFPGLGVDAFVVMPNHVHGIVVLGGAFDAMVDVTRYQIPGASRRQDPGAMNRAPAAFSPAYGTGNSAMTTHAGTDAPTPHTRPTYAGTPFMASTQMAAPPRTPRTTPTLGDVIRAFKAVTARAIRVDHNPDFAWQRNYHDWIVRGPTSLARFRRYIQNNPRVWSRDRNNPQYERPQRAVR